jgi:hypothetical protein
MWSSHTHHTHTYANSHSQRNKYNTYLRSLRGRGPQIVPPFLIFKGKGLGKGPDADKERLFLNSLEIGYYFTETGSATRAYHNMWLNMFEDTLRRHGIVSTQLLLLDDYGVHWTPEYQEKMFGANIFPFPIPGGSY